MDSSNRTPGGELRESWVLNLVHRGGCISEAIGPPLAVKTPPTSEAPSMLTNADVHVMMAINGKGNKVRGRRRMKQEMTREKRREGESTAMGHPFRAHPLGLRGDQM